jgi:hypothetical protein
MNHAFLNMKFQIISRGRFLNQFQNLTLSSFKLEANKFIPIKLQLASSQLEIDLRTALRQFCTVYVRFFFLCLITGHQQSHFNGILSTTGLDHPASFRPQTKCPRVLGPPFRCLAFLVNLYINRKRH